MDWREEIQLKQKAQEYYEKEFSYNQVYIQGYLDAYNKAIDEFAEALNKKISDFVLEHRDNLDFASGTAVVWNMVDEIAEQMKGGAV